MTFITSAMRLETRLNAHAVFLTPVEMSALDAALQCALEGTDLSHLKKATHLLRAQLTRWGKSIPQALAFESMAAYVGARDWNTLRKRAEAGQLDLASPRQTQAPRRVMFEREGLTWARFVYTVQSKTMGYGNIDALGRSFPGLRVRLVSLVNADIRPVLVGWKRTFEHSRAPILQDIARERATHFAEMARSAPTVTRLMRHHVIVEMPLGLPSGKPVSPVDAGDIRFVSVIEKRIASGLARAFNAELTLTPSQVEVPWLDCSRTPEGETRRWYARSVDVCRAHQHALLWSKESKVQPWTEVPAPAGDFGVFVDMRFVGGGAAAHAEVLNHGIAVPRGSSEEGASGNGPFLRSEVDLVLRGAPMFAPYPGDTGKGLLVVDRSHGVTRYPVLDERNAAGNFAIIGSSGTGKSFLAREIVSTAYAEGKRVRVMDGFDYHWFVHNALGASTYRLDAHAPVSLNPLSGVKDEKDLDRLVPVLTELMLELAGKTDSACVDLVTLAIREAWSLAGVALEVSHVRDCLAEQRWSQESQELSHALGELVERHGAWLMGPCAISLERRVVLFDTQNLRYGYGDTQQCVMQLLMALLHREAVTDGNALHLYDEIHHIRPGDRYANKLVRDCNDCGVSIGIVGQALETEILHSGLGQAIYARRPVYLVSLLRDEHSERFACRVGLTEDELAQMHVLRWRIGDFSIVKNGQLQGQFWLPVDMKTRCAYETRLEDAQALKEFMEVRNLSYSEAVRELAERAQVPARRMLESNPKQQI
jgi:hypothetical protein